MLNGDYCIIIIMTPFPVILEYQMLVEGAIQIVLMSWIQVLREIFNVAESIAI